LLHHCQQIKIPAKFQDFAILDAEEIHASQGERPAYGRDT
jgi:hypothetical protein